MDLPDALVKELDAVHERFRNPCVYYADKEVWNAHGDAGRAAKEPEE